METTETQTDRQTDRSVKARSRAKKEIMYTVRVLRGSISTIRGVEGTYEYGTGKKKLGSFASLDLSHVAPPARQQQLN